MTDFALGDIVVMKMGGPWMTVVQICSPEAPNPWVRCVWFDHEHHLQADIIYTFALKPVELVA